MMDSMYEIRQLSFDDIKDFEMLVSLQNIVYEGKHSFSINGFVQRYKHNPWGDVVSFNAFCEGELVAHYACVPYKMTLAGKDYLGLLDIATVTHPNHRGKGLFKKLASITFKYAKEHGYKFVIGVANANSYPGYMKYFPFNFVGQLDVKIGIGSRIFSDIHKENFVCWDEKSLMWRLQCSGGNYTASKRIIFGKKQVPFVKLIMSKNYNFDDVNLPYPSTFSFFNLYIGFGANLKKGLYFKLPKFVKRPPFNLIFLDLTGGILPKITKDNILFQLIDFDVA